MLRAEAGSERAAILGIESRDHVTGRVDFKFSFNSSSLSIQNSGYSRFYRI